MMNEYIKIGASLAPKHEILTPKQFIDLWLHQIDVKRYAHNHMLVEMFEDYTLGLQGYQDTGGTISYKNIEPLSEELYLGALIIVDTKESLDMIKVKAKEFPNCIIGNISDEAELHVRIPASQMKALKVYFMNMPEVFFVIGEGDI